MQWPYRGLLAKPSQDGAEDASSTQAAEMELTNKQTTTTTKTTKTTPTTNYHQQHQKHQKMRWVSSNLQQLFPFLPILNIHPCFFDHSFLSWLKPFREKEEEKYFWIRRGGRGVTKIFGTSSKSYAFFVLLVCGTCIIQPGLGLVAGTCCPPHPPPSLTLTPFPWTLFLKHLYQNHHFYMDWRDILMWQKSVVTYICLGWLQCQDTQIQVSGSSSPFWGFGFGGRRN